MGARAFLGFETIFGAQHPNGGVKQRRCVAGGGGGEGIPLCCTGTASLLNQSSGCLICLNPLRHEGGADARGVRKRTVLAACRLLSLSLSPQRR